MPSLSILFEFTDRFVFKYKNPSDHLWTGKTVSAGTFSYYLIYSWDNVAI